MFEWVEKVTSAGLLQGILIRVLESALTSWREFNEQKHKFFQKVIHWVDKKLLEWGRKLRACWTPTEFFLRNKCRKNRWRLMICAKHNPHQSIRFSPAFVLQNKKLRTNGADHAFWMWCNKAPGADIPLSPALQNECKNQPGPKLLPALRAAPNKRLGATVR